MTIQNVFDVIATCSNSPALKLFIDWIMLTNSFSVLWSVSVILAVIVNKRFSAWIFNAFNPPNSLLLAARIHKNYKDNKKNDRNDENDNTKNVYEEKQ